MQNSNLPDRSWPFDLMKTQDRSSHNTEQQQSVASLRVGVFITRWILKASSTASDCVQRKRENIKNRRSRTNKMPPLTTKHCRERNILNYRKWASVMVYWCYTFSKDSPWKVLAAIYQLERVLYGFVRGCICALFLGPGFSVAPFIATHVWLTPICAFGSHFGDG